MNKTAKKLIGAGALIALIAVITAFAIPSVTGQAAGSKSTAHHSALSHSSIQTTAAVAGLKDSTVRDVTSDCWNDSDGDGICDNCQTAHEDGACSNWTDSNNDGVCDNYGSGQENGTNSNWTDQNNDGVCDNYGSGNGNGSGHGHGNGNGHGNGHGNGNGHGKGCR